MKLVTFFLPVLVQLFLGALKPDEYQVLMNQQQLFTAYEKVLVAIAEVSPQSLNKSLALPYARALFKGANIYRRVATEKSIHQALACHRRALSLRKIHLHQYHIDIAHSYRALGATYNELHGKAHNVKAIAYYKKALSIYHLHHDTLCIASTLNNLANAYRDLDDTHVPLAISYLDRALSFLSDLPESHERNQEQGKMLYNQGKNYHRLGGAENCYRARDYLLQAKGIFERCSDSVRTALTLSYLGCVYTSMGYEYKAQALDCLHKALTLLRKMYDEENPQIVTALERLKAAEMRILPLTRDTIPGVKQVIADAWNDVMGLHRTVHDWQSDGYFDPIDNFETAFLLFLTLIDGSTVVGSAAVRHLDGDICELKRMGLLRPYRRHGWGSQMLVQLLQVAKDHGYRYVRLEVYRPSKQAPAIAFYRKFGFYEIPPYCESLPEALFMEKELF